MIIFKKQQKFHYFYQKKNIIVFQFRFYTGNNIKDPASVQRLRDIDLYQYKINKTFKDFDKANPTKAHLSLEEKYDLMNRPTTKELRFFDPTEMETPEQIEYFEHIEEIRKQGNYLLSSDPKTQALAIFFSIIFLFFLWTLAEPESPNRPQPQQISYSLLEYFVMFIFSPFLFLINDASTIEHADMYLTTRQYYKKYHAYHDEIQYVLDTLNGDKETLKQLYLLRSVNELDMTFDPEHEIDIHYYILDTYKDYNPYFVKKQQIFYRDTTTDMYKKIMENSLLEFQMTYIKELDLDKLDAYLYEVRQKRYLKENKEFIRGEFLKIFQDTSLLNFFLRQNTADYILKHNESMIFEFITLERLGAFNKMFEEMCNERINILNNPKQLNLFFKDDYPELYKELEKQKNKRIIVYPTGPKAIVVYDPLKASISSAELAVSFAKLSAPKPKKILDYEEKIKYLRLLNSINKHHNKLNLIEKDDEEDEDFKKEYFLDPTLMAVQFLLLTFCFYLFNARTAVAIIDKYHTSHAWVDVYSTVDYFTRFMCAIFQLKVPKLSQIGLIYLTLVYLSLFISVVLFFVLLFYVFLMGRYKRINHPGAVLIKKDIQSCDFHKTVENIRMDVFLLNRASRRRFKKISEYEKIYYNKFRYFHYIIKNIIIKAIYIFFKRFKDLYNAYKKEKKNFKFIENLEKLYYIFLTSFKESIEFADYEFRLFHTHPSNHRRSYVWLEKAVVVTSNPNSIKFLEIKNHITGILLFPFREISTTSNSIFLYSILNIHKIAPINASIIDVFGCILIICCYLFIIPFISYEPLLGVELADLHQIVHHGTIIQAKVPAYDPVTRNVFASDVNLIYTRDYWLPYGRCGYDGRISFALGEPLKNITFPDFFHCQLKKSSFQKSQILLDIHKTIVRGEPSKVLPNIYYLPNPQETVSLNPNSSNYSLAKWDNYFYCLKNIDKIVKNFFFDVMNNHLNLKNYFSDQNNY